MGSEFESRSSKLVKQTGRRQVSLQKEKKKNKRDFGLRAIVFVGGISWVCLWWFGHMSLVVVLVLKKRRWRRSGFQILWLFGYDLVMFWPCFSYCFVLFKL